MSKWAYGTSPLIAGIAGFLRCDDTCDITATSRDGELVIRHRRGERDDRIAVSRSIGAHPDQIVMDIKAALEPLKATHWHEPVPNWVGEAVVA